jgi:hypothetical protein
MRCSYRVASEKALQIEAKKKEMVELLRLMQVVIGDARGVGG